MSVPLRPALERPWRPRGMTFVEMVVALTLASALALAFVKATALYEAGLVRAAATQFVSNVSNCKKVASQAHRQVATIIFRPTDAPYVSYRVTTEDGTQEFRLPRGIRIVNTNGIIKNHQLRINVVGAVVDEHGQVIRAPEAGLVTFISNSTDRIYVVRINPNTGVAVVL